MRREYQLEISFTGIALKGVDAMEQQPGNQESKVSAADYPLPLALGIGMAIGAGVGAAIGNIAVGIGTGIAVGVAVGLGLYRRRKNKSSDN